MEDGKHTLSIFLDLSKAFDCVDHSILLEKLESYGIRGVAYSWIKSYLADRSQVVQISNQFSKANCMSFGVPQGSILSSLLFLIFLNDIGSSLELGRLVKYADDTTICSSSDSIEVLEIQTFIELNTCFQDFININLKTNTSKSNFIHFSLKSTDCEAGPTVMLSDTMLEEVYSTKFL